MLIAGMLVLLMAFRSVLIVVIAAVANTAVLGAAAGIIVLVFGHGWGSALLGAGSAGPVESVVPVLIVGVMFGLSMDYEVFLLSSIYERWHQSGDTRRSIRDGVTHTAPVLIAAALIMFSVFASFAAGGVRLIAEFGLGLALAVLLDVFVVRLAMIPALMFVSGGANWWLPRWLGRLLPNLSIEASADDDDAAAPSADHGQQRVSGHTG